MVENVMDSTSVLLFAPDQNQQPTEAWQEAEGLPTTDNVLIHLSQEPQTGAANPEHATVFLDDPDRREFWRGMKVLSEDEAAEIDFPYPPEPDYEND